MSVKRKRQQLASVPLVFPRSDPEALRRFDPATKTCSMNCGRHIDDPRSEAERKFQCEDCWPVVAAAHNV